MTWRCAGAYFGLFVVLTAYYAATEPSSQAGRPQLPARRSFLEIGPEDVRAVIIESNGLTVRCVRDGTRWRAEQPPRAIVPSDLVGALVDQLTQVPDVEVVDEQGERAAQFGLVPPQGTVKLILKSGRTIAVALGARNPAQTAVYGRVEGAPRVVLLGLNVRYYQELIVQAARGATG